MRIRQNLGEIDKNAEEIGNDGRMLRTKRTIELDKNKSNWIC